MEHINDHVNKKITLYLQRAFPFFPENCCLQDGPLVVSQYFEQECTVGCWSLSRPAVLFIGKEDGSVEVWDLLKNTSEPLQLHAHISNTRITCMKPWSVSGEKHLCFFYKCLSYFIPTLISFSPEQL